MHCLPINSLLSLFICKFVTGQGKIEREEIFPDNISSFHDMAVTELDDLRIKIYTTEDISSLAETDFNEFITICRENNLVESKKYKVWHNVFDVTIEGKNGKTLNYPHRLSSERDSCFTHPGYYHTRSFTTCSFPNDVHKRKFP